jgi:hypothetical protein
MAHRLDTYVIQGELSNLCRNSITGRLEVLRAQTINGRTVIRPALLLLSLTGNLSSGLSGQRFRFSLRQPLAAAVKPLPDFFHSEQIGVISDSLLRMIDLPTDVESQDPHHNPGLTSEPSVCQQRASVYLQWHSQNGAVALELLDSLIQFERVENLSFGPADPGESDAVAASPFPPAVSSFLNSDDTCFEIVADNVATLKSRSGSRPPNTQRSRHSRQRLPAVAGKKSSRELTPKPNASMKHGTRCWGAKRTNRSRCCSMNRSACPPQPAFKAKPRPGRFSHNSFRRWPSVA